MTEDIHSTRHRRLETAKVDLLVKAVAQAARHPEPGVSALVMRFYRDVPPDDLLGRDPGDVIGAVLSQRALAAVRHPGETLVRVLSPSIQSDGWSDPHTVVQVVTDDMPFLVDSVTAELGRQGRAVHLVVHPQLSVRRDGEGRLLEILGLDLPAGAEPDVPAGDTIVESWMSIEVDRETDPEDLMAIDKSLRHVLRDVRAAVEDWPTMRATAARLADELSAAPPATVPADEVVESVAFLRWLADQAFVFVGYREYDLVGEPGEEGLTGVDASGLGVLQGQHGVSTTFAKLPPAGRARARDPEILVLTKANRRSTVHRDAYLDYVGVKRFAPDGTVTGEHRFIGLYASTAYTQPVTTIPLVSRKIAAVLARSGFRPEGHSYRDLLRVLETYPRDELFQIDTGTLYDIAMAVLYLHGRRHTRVFLRPDRYGRFVSALVYLPRDRYTTAVRLRVAAVLEKELGGSHVDYTARVSESAEARLHFVVRMPPGAEIPDVDPTDLEARVVEACRSWDDDLSDAVFDQLGEERGASVLRRYARAFPEGYKEDFSVRAAVADIAVLDGLEADRIAVSFYELPTPTGTEQRFKLYRLGEPISLSTVLPILSRMGVEVTDERPYELEPCGAWVYDFGLRLDRSTVQGGATLKRRFEEAFDAAWYGRCEVDGFNALVVRAGLTWQQVVSLRAYARYLRQAGIPFSQEFVESTLAAHVEVTCNLLQFFEYRFDPDIVGDRQALCDEVLEKVSAGLDAVASLDQDRTLRALLALMAATQRTNAYQGQPDVLAFKLDPHAIPDLPKPLPMFEIWVYSPQVEGVHLRFARIARGGLRWSDRREDFRTEILGLVKAQTVKNAVIVPGGAKGGFVARLAPDPSVDRDAWMAQGVASYKAFVGALLDLTDNLVDGAVVPPDRVVRHDGDDPYLVVAADKGTATFSDIANEVAVGRGFWLGDAFASGGSAGYDHKAMGITARGAWESVKRHFRELGVDVQTESVTAVGVGDMSGDVFGNGMLLSEPLRLVAAFDHRHVFLDPSPDPTVAFAERRRLFDLPRSSWADYDPALISEGGGVFPRSAKSITLSEQVRAVLGTDATALTPAELIRAILTAPVDLLWNGGIGTYVKASTESNAAVGDKANDAVRVDGAALRARVVGEGGNLGLTQLGRVEAAQAGVRLNTDAIDNSAGVDTSDHEVNIKIALDRRVRAGELAPAARNRLLASMTDEVAAHVLADNYAQNAALGTARSQARGLLRVHERMMRRLEAEGELDRALEFLPSDAEIARRHAAGTGLTSPELSVMLAYAKTSLTAALRPTGFAAEPWFAQALTEYFSDGLDDVDTHPLRDEIITCVAVNDMVNRGGVTFAFRAWEETGAGPAEILRAYSVTREVFGLRDFWRHVESLDLQIPTAAQTVAVLEARRLLDRGTRWVLQSRGGTVDVGAEVDRLAPDVSRLARMLPDLLVGDERERLFRRAGELEGKGLPRDLAFEAAGLLDIYGLLDVVTVAGETGVDAEEVARVYFVLSERYEVDTMLTRITALPRDDRWSALARASLRSDLYAALTGLTRRVVTTVTDVEDPDERVRKWESRQAEGHARARATLEEMATQDEIGDHSLATLSVALRTMRTLVDQGT